MTNHNHGSTPLEKQNQKGEIIERDNSRRMVSKWELRIRDIASRPRRHPVLHWTAFVLALVSASLPVAWLIRPEAVTAITWIWLDVGLSLFFAGEFLTRDGFRWNRSGYLRSRAFEFVAIVPVLVLTHYGVIFSQTWVWLILIARVVRAIDRLLGDGFIERNIFALIEAFEEEITDRVLLRIMARIQEDLDRGRFGHSLAVSLAKNKEEVLKRIHAEHPQQGMGVEIARLVGLETALEKTEDRIYESIVEVVGSTEMEKAIRESVDSVFAVMREQIATKAWKKEFGLRTEVKEGNPPEEKK